MIRRTYRAIIHQSHFLQSNILLAKWSEQSKLWCDLPSLLGTHHLWPFLTHSLAGPLSQKVDIIPWPGPLPKLHESLALNPSLLRQAMWTARLICESNCQFAGLPCLRVVLNYLHIPQRTSPWMSCTLRFHYEMKCIRTVVKQEQQNSNWMTQSMSGVKWQRIISKIKRIRRHLAHTRPPFSSSHNRIFKTFAANDSASFSVSPGATAANTNMPFPIDDISCLSTVTEADSTRWSIAKQNPVSVKTGEQKRTRGKVGSDTLHVYR